MTSRILPTAVVLLALLGAAWLVWPDRQPMPVVDFTLTDGRQLQGSELRGRPLLLNFWSISCEVCLHDMPKLTRLAETLTDKGLNVIGVAMSYDPPPAIIEAVERLQPGYPIALDVSGDIARAFGNVDVTPTTFLIGPDGALLFKGRGALDEIRIRATLLTL
ncbi:MAG: TlpA family protein disulfide reductase [Gammaproteobacteria bacterium]|nr:TlpA family protein disulfide reductase [Gammaproteobacteria bacterium]